MTDAIIIGGGSGMGLALARTLLAENMNVTIVGRSADRLATARAELERPGHGKISTIAADMGREEDVAALFAQVERVEHVAVTAADATGVYGRTVDVATATARAIVETKLLGAWLVGKHAAGRVTGSITYTSGINAYRPNGSNTIMAAANGALASLAYGLAIELAPVRVNVISPGWVDTPIWDQLGMDKQTAFAELAARLPARRVGTPDDIAQAFLSVIHNGFITGTVLHVDGGHRIT
ncbi:SDR family oxidoreductase [Streptomyces sp. NBC_00151]|uniref:SDR family oxidoreductase n=1 Tax=Streptomyces sp. NBC_00151 TaxID=2975669 RepID=UPI002DD89410|nr:SDR family oxidoreductase [Streptomyces sp. NBC_00151]WRZ37341.1 SDR family oxidoreductase [Streptomyces sp. NBC_00151]